MTAKDDPRQEIEIELGGHSFRIRPTFTVLTGIESALDQSARSLGLKCWAVAIPIAERPAGVKEISLVEMTTILWCMLRGKENAPASAQDVGEILVDEGYEQFCGPVGEFLLRAQKGNKHHLREIERTAAKASEDGGASENPPQSKGA